MTYKDLEREAATHFREIINRLNTSEETKGGENKTKYSFLSKDHRCTIKTGYFPSKIEEGNIAEDADMEDFEIISWSNPNTLELI